MKKIIPLMGLIGLLSVAAIDTAIAAPIPKPLVGLWACHHDQIESFGLDARNFNAQASFIQNGRYLFRAINPDYVDDGGSEQFMGSVYVTLDGDLIHIEIPDSPITDTASATLLATPIASGVRLDINGSINVDTHSTIMVDIPAPDGRVLTLPQVVKGVTPVDFGCSRIVYRSDD